MLIHLSQVLQPFLRISCFLLDQVPYFSTSATSDLEAEADLEKSNITVTVTIKNPVSSRSGEGNRSNIFRLLSVN